MDLSTTYVDMCREADIQDDWVPSEGDFTTPFPPYRGTIILDNTINTEDACGNRCVTWLPRQDQLVEMVPDIVRNLPIEINKLKTHDVLSMKVITGHNFEFFYGNSFEQMWLAFIMSEKYGKRWDGGNWTKW